MPQVRLPNETDGHGNAVTIEVVGEWPDYESVLRAHGYDPSRTEYGVDDPDAALQEAIQNASNLQELKDALTSPDHPARAKGRNR